MEENQGVENASEAEVTEAAPVVEESTDTAETTGVTIDEPATAE